MRTELIVALDMPTGKMAIDTVDAIGSDVQWYKVGLELFLNTGGTIIDALKNREKKIFLDLKFHDIPNTVAQACRWAAATGVDLFNVHAVGGSEMMRRAKDAADEGAAQAGLVRPALIAVTILTSMDAAMLRTVGLGEDVNDAVRRLALVTADAGLDGVVCSSKEVRLIKETITTPFLTICPGIRPQWAAKDDQKRIMTPAEAAAIGVSHIVVGRPITRSTDPALAAARILEELAVK